MSRGKARTRLPPKQSGLPVEPTGQFAGPRRYWDDEAFKRNVEVEALKKGETVREAMRGAGLSADYLNKDADRRYTDIVGQIADYFKVHPNQLAGWVQPDAGAGAAPAEEPPVSDATEASDTPIDTEQLRRLIVVARSCAAHTAALLYIASDPPRNTTEPAKLAEAIIRQLDN